MSRLKMTLALTLVGGLLASSCSERNANRTDLDEPVFVEDVATAIEARPPDDVTVFINVDNHPNIASLCIDGIAFRTISNFHSGGLDGAVARVPEWDDYCAGHLG